jgi:hypothetical protein
MTGALIVPLRWFRRALSPGPRKPPAPPVRRKPKPTLGKVALFQIAQTTASTRRTLP